VAKAAKARAMEMPRGRTRSEQASTASGSSRHKDAHQPRLRSSRSVEDLREADEQPPAAKSPPTQDDRAALLAATAGTGKALSERFHLTSALSGSQASLDTLAHVEDIPGAGSDGTRTPSPAPVALPVATEPAAAAAIASDVLSKPVASHGSPSSSQEETSASKTHVDMVSSEASSFDGVEESVEGGAAPLARRGEHSDPVRELSEASETSILSPAAGVADEVAVAVSRATSDDTMEERDSAIELAVCGSEFSYEVDDASKAACFEAGKISFERLRTGPNIVNDPSCVVRVNKKCYLPWAVAGPLVLSHIIFGQPLPDEAVGEWGEGGRAVPTNGVTSKRWVPPSPLAVFLT
jgi:hypothetical protein